MTLMKIPFTKMHGLGNDFMVLDLTGRQLELTPEKIRALSDRNFGVGFDQLLLVEKSDSDAVDFHYRIFNTDGSEVEHCGNGARCIAMYIHDKGLSWKKAVKVKTLNRSLLLTIHDDDEVSVDMGIPEFNPAVIPFLSETTLSTYQRSILISGKESILLFSALSMGNPHAVIFVEDLRKTAVKDIGEALGTHTDFPEGVNVSFMEIVSRREIQLRVFERGAGETLACGSGACAAVVAGRMLEKLDPLVQVNLPGGQLKVSWNLRDSVIMRGPTQTVYEGIIEL
tara:strand:- start:391 stop:1239 length:849 start_codon:yes stop_codon:yes gene_type:complete